MSQNECKLNHNIWILIKNMNENNIYRTAAISSQTHVKLTVLYVKSIFN